MARSKHIKTVVEERIVEIQKQNADPLRYGPIKTGIEDLDRMIGGITPGRFIAIGGTHKSGKTTLALQLAQVIASAGRGMVGYFPLEERDSGLADRVIARSSVNITRSRIRDLQLTDDDFREAQELAALFLGDISLVVTDEVSTVVDVVKETKEKQYKFVILDYLGLFTDNQNKLNETQRLDLISRLVAEGVRETEATFILVFQLNKENRAYGSSAVYRDADLIIHIEPHKSTMGEEVDGMMDIVVENSRIAKGGGRISVILDGDHSRILSVGTRRIDLDNDPKDVNTLLATIEGEHAHKEAY